VRPWHHRGHHLLFLLLLLTLSATCQAASITDYVVIRQPVLDQAGRELIAIRSFKSDGKAELLTVDPYSFGTSVLRAAEARVPEPSAASLSDSPFMTALARHTSGPFRLQNAGASRADAAVDGVCLTVDLCPSKRRFEREMFEAAAALGNGAPVPMTVAITGAWLSNHPEEVAFLKQEVAAGKLSITWMNHSHHHVYEPKVPLTENFLLTPGTDFDREVLELEQQLLAVGLVPSPFFRFPGLVSDKATITRLRELSLIPIGSDAWLAKGESPRKGSFILVHGNGNEPKGIRLVLPMLKNRELHLLPLAQAFGGKGSIYQLPRDGYGQNSTTTRSNSPVVPAPASPAHGQATAQNLSAGR
jgi:peptidoglycan/xylan/chitin deacetylase (PgdA/CDA1 family)